MTSHTRFAVMATRTATLAATLALLALAGCSVGGSNAAAPVDARALQAGGRPVYGRVVQVQVGESLGDIARRMDSTVPAIAAANGLRPPYALEAGSTLTIPNPAFYDVQPGDTLEAISRRFAVPVGVLVTANGLPSADQIRAGQRLGLGGTAAPMPMVASRSSGTLAQPADLGAVAPTALVAPALGPRPEAQALSAPTPLGAAGVPADSAVGRQPLPVRPPAGGFTPAVPAAPATMGAGSVTLSQPLAVAPPLKAPGTVPAPQPAMVATRPPSPPAAAPGFRPAAPAPTAAPVNVPPPATAPKAVAALAPPAVDLSRPDALAPPVVKPPAAAPVAAPAPQPVAASASKRYQRPVEGRVISDFGPKAGGLKNDGVNIAAAAGTPVKAAAGGKVVYAGDQLKGYGNLVLIRHNDGNVTAYAHLQDINVRADQAIGPGQVLGSVGTTGGLAEPSLHFEVREGTKPVDPKPFIGLAAG